MTLIISIFCAYDHKLKTKMIILRDNNEWAGDYLSMTNWLEGAVSVWDAKMQKLPTKKRFLKLLPIN